MLIRSDSDDALLITQPAHAWMSGQIARTWGNDGDRSFQPREAVCLAAGLHDIGWLDWERAPALNPETGLPYTFREMPRETHIELWSRARENALAFGRYPALLVSMHGTGLFERFGPGPDAPERERTAVAGFLERERAEQQALVDALASDPDWAPWIDSDVLAQNRQLIGLWDGMSLVLCNGLDAGGTTIGDFTLAPLDGQSRVTVDPWPFARERVGLSVDARRLRGRHADQAALDAALGEGIWTTLRFELEPAGEAVS